MSVHSNLSGGADECWQRGLAPFYWHFFVLPGKGVEKGACPRSS